MRVTCQIGLLFGAAVLERLAGASSTGAAVARRGGGLKPPLVAGAVFAKVAGAGRGGTAA